MQSALNAPHLRDEAAAFAYVEARLWPHGPVCHHCGVIGEATAMKGKTTRVGLYNCRACRKPFTVRMGTIFESSHVPLHVWLQAIYLICSSKKGISTRQMQRTLGGSMKTAWFLMHRIREAMRDGKLGPLGGENMVVEADETYYGHDGNYLARGGKNMNAVLSMVDRKTGRVRAMVLNNVTANAVAKAVGANVAPDTRLLTDSARAYRRIGAQLADHQSVNHSIHEYVRKGEPDVHTNTVEGTFSIFKRGMRGIYQHCAAKHLPRYLAEFDFRYSNRIALGVDDRTRADNALMGVVGKRLTYETVSARRPGEEVRIIW